MFTKSKGAYAREAAKLFQGERYDEAVVGLKRGLQAYPESLRLNLFIDELFSL